MMDAAPPELAADLLQGEYEVAFDQARRHLFIDLAVLGAFVGLAIVVRIPDDVGISCLPWVIRVLIGDGN